MAGALLSRPPQVATPGLLARLRWPLLLAVPILVLAIWFITSGDSGLFNGRAGFTSVSGTWRFDAVAYEAKVAALEANLAGRAGGAVNAKLTAAKLRALAAPWAKRSLIFTNRSYLISGTGGSGGRETACTYVGESAVFLHVIGVEPGEADDLTIVLDPTLNAIYLRSDDLVLPFIRE